MNTRKWSEFGFGIWFRLVFLIASSMAIFGCSSAPEEDTTSVEEPALSQDSVDVALIQEMFTEAAVRWHYGDKAVLYDLEFEYLQEKYTLDEYLDFEQIQYLEADTLESMTVKNVLFFYRDSATVTAEAMFIGPTNDTSYYTDDYRVHYHRGRWIHPSAGSIDLQLEYEELRRVADSAVAADAELEGY